jgi:hypothetical protein
VETRRHPRLINSIVERGLIISAAFAVYGALGVLGYFGKRWIAEGHEKPALLGIFMGLGIACQLLVVELAKWHLDHPCSDDVSAQESAAGTEL